jgi:hypothetical protein
MGPILPIRALDGTGKIADADGNTLSQTDPDAA